MKATVLKKAAADWGAKRNSAFFLATVYSDWPPIVGFCPVAPSCFFNSLSAPFISSSVSKRATRRAAFTVYNPKDSEI